jgi:hypothetical protein
MYKQTRMGLLLYSSFIVWEARLNLRRLCFSSFLLFFFCNRSMLGSVQFISKFAYLFMAIKSRISTLRCAYDKFNRCSSSNACLIIIVFRTQVCFSFEYTH